MASGQSHGGVGDRRRAPAARRLGRTIRAWSRESGDALFAQGYPHCVGDYPLRLCRQRTAGLAAARAARLFEHIHEARHHLRSGAGRISGFARVEISRGQPLH